MKALKVIAVVVAGVVVLWITLRLFIPTRYVSDFLTPIVFYGKVIDQNGDPVPGADIRVSFANNPGGGSGERHVETDSNGQFSAWGVGLGIVVIASKSGYDTLDRSSGNFTYNQDAGHLDRHSTAHSEAILELRKLGKVEPLAIIHRDVKIARDGTPVQLILATGKTYNVTEGDIQVRAWTHDEGRPPNSNQPYDWRCEITVPSGGIRPRNGGEFDFVAPPDGYLPSEEIDMPATAKRWSDNLSRSYFIHLKDDRYARIDFTMRAGGDHFFEIISCAAQQPGNRNLEASQEQMRQ